MRPIATHLARFVVSVCGLDTLVNLAKTAEQIEMLSSGQIRAGPRNRVFDRVHTGATWRIRLNRLCARRYGFMSNYFDRLLCSRKTRH